MSEKHLKSELNLLTEDVHSGNHAREIKYKQILFCIQGTTQRYGHQEIIKNKVSKYKEYLNTEQKIRSK